MNHPDKIPHCIGHREDFSKDLIFFPKNNPATGNILFAVSRGKKEDVDIAVDKATESFLSWSRTPAIERSDILRKTARYMQENHRDIAWIVSLETGKSFKDAIAEVSAATEMGFFVAGEGRRFYGRTTNSAMPNRTAETRRQPVGVCALIIAANTPIANIAWKVFPALLCGNTVVLKPSEDAPQSAVWFAKALKHTGLPDGVFSVVQGTGKEAGAALVKNNKVDLISFTGSVEVGKWIQKTAGGRLAKACLELGGKNPFVVCDDADLPEAVKSAVLSAFSNAGQRCASGSRIIVFESVYELFKQLLIQKTKELKVGHYDSDDLGPVINENQLKGMMKSLRGAIKRGAVVLTGGKRLRGGDYQKGYYLEPTILEGVSPKDEISRQELFGPITILYKVRGFNEALALANDSPFGLTAAIHTKSIHRAEVFKEKCRAGVISVNGPTYGSEPHMPFGGLRNSGNGWREAGTEALDVYSEWKTIYTKHFPEKI